MFQAEDGGNKVMMPCSNVVGYLPASIFRTEAARSSKEWCHITSQFCNPEDHDINLYHHEDLSSCTLKNCLLGENFLKQT
jgi:hypothetical protein